jgi:hypothetical protein
LDLGLLCRIYRQGFSFDFPRGGARFWRASTLPLLLLLFLLLLLLLQQQLLAVSSAASIRSCCFRFFCFSAPRAFRLFEPAEALFPQANVKNLLTANV